MATVTTLKLADELRPYASDRPHAFSLVFEGAADTADNGDDITLFTLPPKFILLGVTFAVSATLGASCTAQLRVGTTAITAATTAGSSDEELQSAASPYSTSSQTVNILIGGADIAAAANFTVQGIISPVEQQTV